MRGCVGGGITVGVKWDVGSRMQDAGCRMQEQDAGLQQVGCTLQAAGGGMWRRAIRAVAAAYEHSAERPHDVMPPSLSGTCAALERQGPLLVRLQAMRRGACSLQRVARASVWGWGGSRPLALAATGEAGGEY